MAIKGGLNLTPTPLYAATALTILALRRLYKSFPLQVALGTFPAAAAIAFCCREFDGYQRTALRLLTLP